jgi:hypothetical protein
MHRHSFDLPTLVEKLPAEFVCKDCSEVVVLERFMDEDGYIRIREVKDA